jgi:four helix bundle protein
MQDFTKLKIWQKSKDLTLEIYSLTSRFPPDEKFGITSQMRRAAASIPANIAEGCGRNSQRDFQRFIYIAIGSCSELESFILISFELKFFTEKQKDLIIDKTDEIRRMCINLIKKLNT